MYFHKYIGGLSIIDVQKWTQDTCSLLGVKNQKVAPIQSSIGTLLVMLPALEGPIRPAMS